MSGVIRSMPAMSSPNSRLASSAMLRFSGWTMALTSSSVPPQAVDSIRRSATQVPAGGTESAR